MPKICFSRQLFCTAQNSPPLKISLSLGDPLGFCNLSLWTGIPHSTLSSLLRYPRYNGIMRSKLMLLGFVVLLRTSGCDKHPLTDYRPLDQAGMGSANGERLRALSTAAVELWHIVEL